MATEILSNEGGLTLNGGKSGVSRGDYTLTVEQSGQTKVVMLRSNNGKVNWTLNPIDTTVDGDDFTTAEDLLIKLNSFHKGGGSGEGLQKATIEDMQQGTDNEKYVTPLIISQYVTWFSEELIKTNNDITEPLTSEDLNNLYPDARLRTTVYTPNTGSGMKYIKISETQWENTPYLVS